MQLRALDQHQQTLSDRQQQLRSVKKTAPHSALIVPFHPLNPLIPQEQRTSKYAAMVRQLTNLVAIVLMFTSYRSIHPVMGARSSTLSKQLSIVKAVTRR